MCVCVQRTYVSICSILKETMTVVLRTDRQRHLVHIFSSQLNQSTRTEPHEMYRKLVLFTADVFALRLNSFYMPLSTHMIAWQQQNNRHTFVWLINYYIVVTNHSPIVSHSLFDWIHAHRGMNVPSTKRPIFFIYDIYFFFISGTSVRFQMHDSLVYLYGCGQTSSGNYQFWMAQRYRSCQLAF